MVKNVWKGLSVIFMIMFMTGCASTKDIEVRGYVDVRDRLDQGMEEGNVGYISGTPQPEDRGDIRKTRKVYVLEVSKEADGDEEAVMVEGADAEAGQELDTSEEYDEEEPELMLPPKESRVMEEDSPTDHPYQPDAASPATVSYTIQKDDTMQKISKKFYDSYSKWPRIYDANRDVIGNPDTIQPGTVIQIPMD